VVGEAGPAVDLDQQLRQVDLGQPWLDQRPQLPLFRCVGTVNNEVAIGQLRLSGRVLLECEPLEQLVLFACERLESFGTVERLIDRLGERRPGLVPLLVGEEQA
jgi:hypothetical protein